MKTLMKTAALVLALTASGSAHAATCVGVTFGAAFDGSYTCNDVGTPTGVVAPLGGLTFLDSNTLLIGGSANNGAGYIAQIALTRDMSNHIIGFSGPSTLFATAPNIDGGLTYGPGGVLFATGYPNNTLMQFLPGSTMPDRIDTLAANLGSVGSIVFVPPGFAGAGDAKLLSYNQGNFVDLTLTPDGFGTYDIATGPTLATLGGGPEGAVYIDGSNAGFGGIDSLLVSEWGAGLVGAYQLDAFGNPIVATRQDFLTGLGGAEGALIDPLTGDFLFSTFGAGNSLFVISGFQAPPPPGGVPEPATWTMMLLGFGFIGGAMRSARRRSRPAALYA